MGGEGGGGTVSSFRLHLVKKRALLIAGIVSIDD